MRVMIKNLPELKYYPKWILYFYPTERMYLLIPWEIINEGWEDQIYGYRVIESKFGIYVYGCKLPKWLKYLTNINDEYYYRRYILNIIDNEVIRCPICGKIKYFTGITHGYRPTCDNPNSCATKIKHILNMLPKFTNKSWINSNYQRFINKGRLDDPCCYYIAWYKDYNWYKIGVTCDKIDERSRAWYSENMNYHILITGTRLEIATLERDIKLYFNIAQEWIKLSRMKEFKDIFRLKVKELNISNKFDKQKFYY